MRRRVRPVAIGDVVIGGEKSIAIQSMLSAPRDNLQENIRQAKALQGVNCDILRVAIPDLESIKLIPALKEAVRMPIVADIHFDYRLALEAVAAGIDKIRINPGNIGDEDRVKAVADTCRSKNIPIRIGVNSGSVEKHILKKYGNPTPQAMVESAMYHASLLERFDYDNIVISMKSNDVPTMVEAYRLAAEQCSYALHLGVTHTGTSRMGIVKSAMGIGSLLLDGIGDTIRVSLADTPEAEIQAAKDILRSAGLRKEGVEVIACPTCGRTSIDVIGLANLVEELLKNEMLPITVAVMGCVVNGPGEARETDLGVSGGDGTGIIFAKGKVVKKVPEAEIIPALLEQVDCLRRERENA